jgi:AraC family transcriptional regulator
MNLTETPEIITWPPTHYVFVEKTGSIPKNAPLTWQEFRQHLSELKSNAKVIGFLSLYSMKDQVYRAGASVEVKPEKLPGNLRYELFPGGKYARFVLTGPYSDLGKATARVVEIVSEQKTALRSAFNIEHYVNDPAITPEDKLVTEILFPVR